MPVTFGPTFKEGKVYRGKRRTEEDEERQALEELQAILNAKNRRSCDCEAQIHDLLENCLNCGRLTCEAEGSGKCFSCGSLVLSQEQRDRLRNHIDIVQSFPVANNNVQNQSSANSRVRIIDSQFDQFAVDDKRHLREDEKRQLKENLEELQSKRYQRKLVLNVDADNLQAGADSKPVVEDYVAEMRKLQVSEVREDATNKTLAQVLSEESKARFRKAKKERGDSKKSDKKPGQEIERGKKSEGSQRQRHSPRRSEDELN